MNEAPDCQRMMRGHKLISIILILLTQNPLTKQRADGNLGSSQRR
jgi:hypothetical protein